MAHKATLTQALSRALADRLMLMDLTIGRKGFLGYLKALAGSNVIKVTPANGNASGERVTDKRLKVVCGSSVSYIADGDWIGDKTPLTLCDVRVCPSNTVKPNIGATELAEALNRVLPFTAKDDARPVLACVNFEAKEGKLTLVSADGFRLAVVTLDYDDEEGQALISRDDLKGVTNALRRAKRARISFEPNGSLDGKNLVLDTELIRYKWQGVNGSYPEWQKLIPTEFKITAHLDAIEALKALQSLKAIADNPKAYPIDITIGDGKMVMANPDDKAQAEVKADADGEMYVRVDGGYLAQVLKAFGGMVDFRLSSPTSPMLFTADGYQVVVMPMVSEKAKEYEAKVKAEQATTEGEQGEATVTTAETDQAEGVTDEVGEEAEPEREPIGAGSGGRRSRKRAR